MQQALAKADEIQIDTISFDNKLLQSFSPNEKENVGVVLDFAHNRQDERVLIELSLTIDGMIKATVSFHYKITDLSRFYTVENDIANFDKPFLSQLCGISYATLRGMLLSSTAETSNALLPIIDPNLIVDTYRDHISM